MKGSVVEKTTILLPKEEATAAWPDASSFSVPDSRMGLSWYDIAGYGTSVWARTASELLTMNHPASATCSASSPSPDHSPLTVASSPTISSTTSPRTSSIDVDFEPLDDKAEKECRVKERSEAMETLTNVFEPSEPSTYEVAAETFSLSPATKTGMEYCSVMSDAPLQIAGDGAN
ncbi:uncharacterized protein LAESUDRAFT_724950 [Laetiporus sulphureus 93-53]|uniref:Uncharacterized protein n=1 Tax=Laetiporus sulphureus 93-53 TaxID=1314785 RepID=A0A165EPG9_9APHY|nr:uncharacterized protein LAESUDRAFT_724950 [Laetiporus sulphureus 93-53]KZT07493.1 hypothetical protein LAESUDRAFT_724950 [Laetiporus sulphureus 93-53]